MGVNNLWKALEKANAVRTLVGHTPGHHAKIVEAVENKVVAVDLSAWLMQAQTQPALVQHYDSAYACAVKVVFDRTIHWLRYGCLPVFVIEGKTPAAKMAKLRERCVAQYGPSARSYDVGNRAGGQFDKLGQAVKRLLDAFGVPCVQAAGEGEAMCAALNLCGWAHACHTQDVDALLFGALTVYRQAHLQTDDPRQSKLVLCERSEIQKALGIKSGGDAALMAVAQLAGGDYDTVGAEQVGENLALAAVTCLLAGCEDDESVLQKLEAALAAGPDPELEALTNCTGCKMCGHEGGMKGRIKQHTTRHGGCSACGTTGVCVPRDWQECECAFHRRADERLLNRVVKRALQTPGFVTSCRTAADAYAEQLHTAIAAVQRDYGLPIGDSTRNVFSWQHRPDVRAVSDIMCKYITDWDHNQVRLKLLPLLLEWDVRQGPRAAPTAGVQFRPASIRKVSGKGAEDNTGVPARQQQGWRYVLQVERLQQHGSNGSSAGAAAAGAEDQAAEDLAIDLAWIAGTARSKPPKAALAASTAAATGGSEAAGGDVCDEDWQFGSQGCFSQYTTATEGTQYTQFTASQAPSSSQAAAGSGGSRSGGSLQFSEHRSVRCSLMEALWPDVVAAYRNPPASGSGRVRSGGSRRKASAAAPVAHVTEDKQHSLKEYYGTVKDYTAAAKPSSRFRSKQLATGGSTIPGLAGIGRNSNPAAEAAEEAPAGAAPSDTTDPDEYLDIFAKLDAYESAAAAAKQSTAVPIPVCDHSTTKKKPDRNFDDWLGTVLEAQQSQDPQQQSQQDMWGFDAVLSSPGAGGAEKHSSSNVTVATATGTCDTKEAAQLAATAAAGAKHGTQRVFVGVRGSTATNRSRSAAAPASAGRSGSARSEGRSSAKQQPAMPAGALDRFLQPRAQAVAVTGQESKSPEQQQMPRPAEHAVQQPAQVVASSPLKRPTAVIDCCSESPEVLPLAARLKSKSTLSSCTAAATVAAVNIDAAAAVAAAAPPAKKVSTCSAKDFLNFPASSSPGRNLQQRTISGSAEAKPLPGSDGAVQAMFTSQYAALLDEVDALSPLPRGQSRIHGTAVPSKTMKGLFGARSNIAQSQQQQQQRQQKVVITLLDSDSD